MTKLVIQGKNVEITDAIRSYVQEKLSVLSAILPRSPVRLMSIYR